MLKTAIHLSFCAKNEEGREGARGEEDHTGRRFGRRAAPRRLHPNDTNKRSVIAGDRGRPTDPLVRRPRHSTRLG